MSLLPIIYQSLLLFSGAAFLVITISFILSKLKSTKETEPEFDLQPMLSESLKQTIINPSPYHTHIGYDKEEKQNTKIELLVRRNMVEEKKRMKPRSQMTDYEIMSFYFG
jgi:hypothetical protein